MIAVAKLLAGGKEGSEQAIAVALEDLGPAALWLEHEPDRHQELVVHVAPEGVLEPGRQVGPAGGVRRGHRPVVQELSVPDSIRCRPGQGRRHLGGMAPGRYSPSLTSWGTWGGVDVRAGREGLHSPVD